MPNQSRVLIVEDDRLQALRTEKMLQKLGYVPVGIADTADKAVKMFNSRKPDLILMDIKLKGDKDGIEAAEEILKFTYTPLIYITGIEGVEFNKRVKESNYFDLLKKPINEERLSHALFKCFI